MTEYDAVVVGAGPNGLAAALTLALAGRRVAVFEAHRQIGGGLRSVDHGEPGYVHDHCASVIPFGAASPFLAPLIADGTLDVELMTPRVQYAHPLDGGRAGLAYRDLLSTAERLGDDRGRYTGLVGPLVNHNDATMRTLLGPPLRRPPSIPAFLRFALRAPWSFKMLARRFSTEEAKGLLAGCAAHSITRLDRPFTGGVATLFAASAHGAGWPLVKGGSQRLADALAAAIVERGGTVTADAPVRSLEDLPSHHIALLDTSPAQLVDLAGDRLPDRIATSMTRFKPGPGVFKVDFTLSDPVPWANRHCREALTLHLGGTAEEVVAAEKSVALGRHADAPFVLAVQSTVTDPGRAPQGRHILWAYCHVPAGSDVDQTSAIERQIERFAPGFRDTVLSRHRTTPTEFERANVNLIGGDIGGGSLRGRQFLFRPRITTRPYDTGDRQVLLCSASTPPGAGIHGMSGHHAALRALELLDA